MRKEPKREPGGHAVLLATCLAVLAGGAAAAISDEAPTVGVQQAEARFVHEPSPAMQAVRPLLARLWASGFFRRNEAVRLELGNNNYVIDDEGGLIAPKGSLSWGCYSRRRDESDTIHLSRALFSHFEFGMDGVIENAKVDRKVLTILVHEISHDLWSNVLDARERAAFARESDELMRDYRRAVTDEERRRFLLLAGDDDAGRCDLQSYSGIDAFLATDPPRGLCGQELFAWLAERLFSTKAKIPIPLRKYYSCIITGIAPVGEEARR